MLNYDPTIKNPKVTEVNVDNTKEFRKEKMMAKKSNQEAKDAVGNFKDKIHAIQKGVCELRDTGIKDSVLYLLIQRNSQRFTNIRNNQISIDDVKAIMRGIATLPDYIFPPEGE